MPPTYIGLGPDEVAPGLRLLAGDDGTKPVAVRWVQPLDTPDAIAIDGGTVLVADAAIVAFDLRDGSATWAVDDHGVAFESSGGVQFGREGRDLLRVFAPWDYDLRIDRRTGHLRSKQLAGGSPAPPVQGLPTSAPSAYRVEAGLAEMVAHRPDGSVAWRLHTDSPFVDPLPAIAAGDAIVLVTSDPYLVVLDPVGGQPAG